MPPALRLLFLVPLMLCAGLPASGFAGVQMAPIADDDESEAAAPTPEIKLPDLTVPDLKIPDAPMSGEVSTPPLKSVPTEITGSINPKAATRDDDLMCAHAPVGSVQRVPAPFKFWAVVVCAPQAQALVPVEGMVWFAHGTREPVSVLALPPGVASLPRTADYNPSYNIRFKDIYVTETKGDKRARAVELLTAAQAQGKPVLTAKEVERVYQLDAVSSIYDMRYNIYFYVSDNLPRAGLICIDACRQMLLVDILNNEEAQARLDKP